MRQDFLKKHSKVIRVIATSISKDEKGIKALLNRNGVNTSSIKSKRDLTNVFVNSLAKSKGLATDFNKYIVGKSKLNDYKNADGKIDFSYTSDDSLWDFKNTTVGSGYNSDLTPSDTQSELEKKGGFFSGITAKDLLNMGMGIFEMQRDMKVSSDNQQAVSDAVNSERTNDELKAGSPLKSNMTMYIVLGVLGVSLLGGIIYYYKKK